MCQSQKGRHYILIGPVHTRALQIVTVGLAFLLRPGSSRLLVLELARIVYGFSSLLIV